MNKNNLMLAVSLLLVGCAPIKLQKGAQNIIVSHNKPSTSCRYVGQVTGNQGDYFTGRYTSNKNMEIGAINDMKNEALKMRANYIQLLSSRAGSTFSGRHFTQTNVVYVGSAYKCPSSAVR